MNKPKTVFITGVNGGIGSSVAKMFKEKGWTVIGTDMAGDESPHCQLFIKKDAGRPSEINEMYLFMQKAGVTHLDCVVHAAAVQFERRIADTTEEEWDQTFASNVGSIFFTAKYFSKLLPGSSIINISSVHARATSVGLAAYVASKGAVSALTRAMALELADQGIRVNSILPGAIDTPMLHQGLSRNSNPEAAMSNLINASPLKRIGQPEDVAHLCYFLADPGLSGNITGQEFVTDSGVLARLASE